MCQYRYLCYSTCTRRVVELIELCKFVKYNAALTPGVDVTPCFETTYKSHAGGTTIPGSYWQLLQGLCRRCLGSGRNASKKEQSLNQYLDMGIYQPVLPPVEEYEEKLHLDGTRIFPNNMHPFMKIFAFEISWFKMLGIEDLGSDAQKSSGPVFSFRGKFDMYQPHNPDGQWKFKFVAPLVDKKPLKQHYIFRNGGLTKFDRQYVFNAISRQNLLWEVYNERFLVRGMTWDHFWLYAVDKWEVPMVPDDGSNAAVAYKMNCELRRMLNLTPLVIAPNNANENLLRVLKAQDSSQQQAQPSMVPDPAAPLFSAPNTQHPQNSYQNYYDAQMMQAPAQSSTYRGPYASSPQPVLQQLYVSPYGSPLGVMQPQMFHKSPYPPLVAAPQAMYPPEPFRNMHMGSLQGDVLQHQHTNMPNLHAPSAQSSAGHYPIKSAPETSHAGISDPVSSEDMLGGRRKIPENYQAAGVPPISSGGAFESKAIAIPKMARIRNEGGAENQAQPEASRDVDTLSASTIQAPFSTPFRSRRDTRDGRIATTLRAVNYLSSPEKSPQKSINASSNNAKSSVLETPAVFPGGDLKLAGTSFTNAPLPVLKDWLFSRGNQAKSASFSAPLAAWHNSAPQVPSESQFASNALESRNHLSGTSAPRAEFQPRFSTSSSTAESPAAGASFFGSTVAATPLQLSGISSFAQQAPPPSLYVSPYPQNPPQAMVSRYRQAGFPHPKGIPPANFGQQPRNMTPSKRHYEHEEASLQSSFEPVTSAKRQRLAGSGLETGGPGPVYAYIIPPRQFTPEPQANPYPYPHPHPHPQELPGKEVKKK